MKNQTARRNHSRSFVEPLENRTLLSGGTSESMHPDVAVPVTHTTLRVSKHVVKLGLGVTFTATVSAARRFGAIAGSIEFLNNGNPIDGTEGALSIALGAHNRASYTFTTGNVALFVGRQRFNAVFVSSNSLPDSESKAAIVNVTVPRLKTASDGLETSTVHPGHGKGVAAGQTATVVYTGFLASNGTIFDYATADHGPGSLPTLSFSVESSPEQVISGFDQGVFGMKVGETRVLAIPSGLAYGPNGSGSIPANADLVFLVKLESIS